MQIKLNVDYNEQYKKGSDGAGLPDDLKRKLVKSGLADQVKPAGAASPAKPKAKAKAKSANRPAQAVAAHRPLASAPTPAAPAATASDGADQ